MCERKITSNLKLCTHQIYFKSDRSKEFPTTKHEQGCHLQVFTKGNSKGCAGYSRKLMKTEQRIKMLVKINLKEHLPYSMIMFHGIKGGI